MSDNYSHVLEYAGAEPFRPEEDRDDISHEEYELLTQDATYQRLAQVRYLANKLETELSGNSDVPKETRDELFSAVATRDAPVTDAVEAYVDDWLARHRSSVPCEHQGCEQEATHEYKVNAPQRGHDVQYLCNEHIEEKQDGVYATIRELDGSRTEVDA